MSASAEIRLQASKKKKSRGSVRNADRLEAFTRGKNGHKADWAGCDPERVFAVMVGITEKGGAVTFGTSRDQGSYSLTLMLGKERETLWFNGDADLDAELTAVVDTLSQID